MLFCFLYFAIERCYDCVVGWHCLLYYRTVYSNLLRTAEGQCKRSSIQKLTCKENDIPQKLCLPICISCKETTFTKCHAHVWLRNMTCQFQDSLLPKYTNQKFVYLVENFGRTMPLVSY